MQVVAHVVPFLLAQTCMLLQQKIPPSHPGASNIHRTPLIRTILPVELLCFPPRVFFLASLSHLDDLLGFEMVLGKTHPLQICIFWAEQCCLLEHCFSFFALWEVEGEVFALQLNLLSNLHLCSDYSAMVPGPLFLLEQVWKSFWNGRIVI